MFISGSWHIIRTYIYNTFEYRKNKNVRKQAKSFVLSYFTTAITKLNKNTFVSQFQAADFKYEFKIALCSTESEVLRIRCFGLTHMLLVSF